MSVFSSTKKSLYNEHFLASTFLDPDNQIPLFQSFHQRRHAVRRTTVMKFEEALSDFADVRRQNSHCLQMSICTTHGLVMTFDTSQLKIVVGGNGGNFVVIASIMVFSFIAFCFKVNF
jgi:hypothetical protein